MSKAIINSDRLPPPKPLSPLAAVWTGMTKLARRIIAIEGRHFAQEQRLLGLERRPAPQDGRDGAAGVGISNALIGRDGNLVLTFTDGRVVDLGRITERSTPGRPA